MRFNPLIELLAALRTECLGRAHPLHRRPDAQLELLKAAALTEALRVLRPAVEAEQRYWQPCASGSLSSLVNCTVRDRETTQHLGRLVGRVPATHPELVRLRQLAGRQEAATQEWLQIATDEGDAFVPAETVEVCHPQV